MGVCGKWQALCPGVSRLLSPFPEECGLRALGDGEVEQELWRVRLFTPSPQLGRNQKHRSMQARGRF